MIFKRAVLARNLVTSLAFNTVLAIPSRAFEPRSFDCCRQCNSAKAKQQEECVWVHRTSKQVTAQCTTIMEVVAKLPTQEMDHFCSSTSTAFQEPLNAPFLDGRFSKAKRPLRTKSGNSPLRSENGPKEGKRPIKAMVLVVRIARPTSLAIWHRGCSHRRPNRSGSPNRSHFASLDLKKPSDFSHRRPTSQDFRRHFFWHFPVTSDQANVFSHR